MNNAQRHFLNFVLSLVLVVAVSALGYLARIVLDSFITSTRLIEPAGVLYNVILALWFYATLFGAFYVRFRRLSTVTGRSTADCVLAFLLVTGVLTLMEEGDWTSGHYRGLFTYLAGIVPMAFGKWAGERETATDGLQVRGLTYNAFVRLVASVFVHGFALAASMYLFAYVAPRAKAFAEASGGFFPAIPEIIADAARDLSIGWGGWSIALVLFLGVDALVEVSLCEEDGNWGTAAGRYSFLVSCFLGLLFACLYFGIRLGLP